ncbi:hypothetical protein [Luteibacter jiangsuensis]
MSKEAKSGELEKEFRPPFNGIMGNVLPLTGGDMYLTASLDAEDADEGVTLLVARVDAEGQADVGFGAGGVASAQVYMRSSVAVPMGVIQESGGKVTAAVVVNRAIGLARFTPEGNLDPTFGDSGTITHFLDRLASKASGAPSSGVSDAFAGTPSDAMSGEESRAVGAMHGGIVPAPGGGTYFVRDSGWRGEPWSYLVRFNVSGRLDRTFAQDGVAYVQHPDYLLTVARAASTVSKGSKVVIVGWVGDSDYMEAFVARFDKSGHLDTTFGDGGFTMVKPPRDPSGTLFTAVDAARDGSIFASGVTKENGRRMGILVGLDSTGNPLLSFNQGEPVLFDLLGPDMENDFGINVAVQADGKIVVVGQARDAQGSMGSVVVTRYLPDGSFDRSFAAPNGWTTINPFGGTDAAVRSSELAPEGKIVIAGQSFRSDEGWVVRLSS